MNNLLLNKRYFEWLYQMVKAKRLSYSKLCWLLYTKEFRAFVPNDQNRCEDGLNLRYTFVELNIFNGQERTRVVQQFLQRSCSVLEVMVALAKRLDFQMYDLEATEDHTARWFMELLHNLKLAKYHDQKITRGVKIDGMAEVEIDEILEILVDRTYGWEGRGSFFPLTERPKKDRAKVEIWYQMMDYLDEKYG